MSNKGLNLGCWQENKKEERFLRHTLLEKSLDDQPWGQEEK
jgi:hypothetical protein